MPVTITSKPDVQGGQWCIDGTRLPVDVIILHIRHGYSNEEITAGFPLATPEAIAATRLWAKSQGQDLTADASLKHQAEAQLAKIVDRRQRQWAGQLSAAE
jgi:uncharacterized protein (DUF433 family)